MSRLLKLVAKTFELKYRAFHLQRLAVDVYDVPSEIDEEVAKLKLDAMGIKLEKQTPDQIRYANSWNIGT